MTHREKTPAKEQESSACDATELPKELRDFISVLGRVAARRHMQQLRAASQNTPLTLL